MKLNSDIGESFGSWKMGMDEEVVKYVDQINIACGFHAGDPDVMQRTLALAKVYQLEIGAHPGYRDLQGFGRRTQALTHQEIVNLIHYQVGALAAMAQAQNLQVTYVKPHGALYNDMMAHQDIFESVLTAVFQLPQKLKLMILASDKNPFYLQLAAQYSVELIFEAFADRRYTQSGKLTPRSDQGAVLSSKDALLQAESLLNKGMAIADNGKPIAIQASSLCVHGDNPEALKLVSEIRRLVVT